MGKFDVVNLDNVCDVDKAIEEGKKQGALEELERCAGTQFDPNLVKKFINFIKKNKLILK